MTAMIATAIAGEWSAPDRCMASMVSGPARTASGRTGPGNADTPRPTTPAKRQDATTRNGHYPGADELATTGKKLTTGGTRSSAGTLSRASRNQ